MSVCLFVCIYVCTYVFIYLFIYLFMIVSLRVRPHEAIQLPLDGFLWDFLFEDFSKICRENPSLIKI